MLQNNETSSSILSNFDPNLRQIYPASFDRLLNYVSTDKTISILEGDRAYNSLILGGISGSYFRENGSYTTLYYACLNTESPNWAEFADEYSILISKFISSNGDFVCGILNVIYLDGANYVFCYFPDREDIIKIPLNDFVKVFDNKMYILKA